jgi:hypothetical protein
LRCKLPCLTIDRDTWNSLKQVASENESVEDVALERWAGGELLKNCNKNIPEGWKEEEITY